MSTSIRGWKHCDDILPFSTHPPISFDSAPFGRVLFSVFFICSLGRLHRISFRTNQWCCFMISRFYMLKLAVKFQRLFSVCLSLNVNSPSSVSALCWLFLPFNNVNRNFPFIDISNYICNDCIICYLSVFSAHVAHVANDHHRNKYQYVENDLPIDSSWSTLFKFSTKVNPILKLNSAFTVNAPTKHLEWNVIVT